jgi:hypothetical protein
MIETVFDEDQICDVCGALGCWEFVGYCYLCDECVIYEEQIGEEEDAGA